MTSVTVALPAGSACPTIQTTTHNNLGYTWENSTLDAQNCWALASVRLTAWTYVYDQTTGTAWGASNDWSGLSKDAGSIVDFTHILENYSNRSYWSENLSESSSSNFSYGPGARATVNLSPQLFINGTFRSTDRYLLEVGITMEVDAELFGFTSGSAFATWGSSQPGQFVQLRSTVW